MIHKANNALAESPLGKREQVSKFLNTLSNQFMRKIAKSRVTKLKKTAKLVLVVPGRYYKLRFLGFKHRKHAKIKEKTEVN
jgi:hypothetical protein